MSKRAEAKSIEQGVIDALAVQTAEITHHLDRWFEQTAGRLAAIEAKLDLLSSQGGHPDLSPPVANTHAEPFN